MRLALRVQQAVKFLNQAIELFRVFLVLHQHTNGVHAEAFFCGHAPAPAKLSVPGRSLSVQVWPSSLSGASANANTTSPQFKHTKSSGNAHTRGVSRPLRPGT